MARTVASKTAIVTEAIHRLRKTRFTSHTWFQSSRKNVLRLRLIDGRATLTFDGYRREQALKRARERIVKKSSLLSIENTKATSAIQHPPAAVEEARTILGLDSETSDWIDRMVVGLKRAETDAKYREALGKLIS